MKDKQRFEMILVLFRLQVIDIQHSFYWAFRRRNVSDLHL